MVATSPSDRDRSRNEAVVLVVLEQEIPKLVFRDVVWLARELQRRVRERFIAELFENLVGVVVVDVRVAARPNKLTQLQIALVRDHHRQQRVAGDVERHTQEHVRTALVQLAGQLPVYHVELEQRVAGRKRRSRDELRVPCRHNVTTRVRVCLDLRDDVGDLVDRVTLCRLPAAPLSSVDLADAAVLLTERVVAEDASLECAQLILPFLGVLDGTCLADGVEVGHERPLGPDGHAVLQQEPDVRVAHQEPDQFDGDPLEVDPLGRDQRKPLREVVADLPAEDALRASTGPVLLVIAVLQDLLKEILVRCRNHSSDGCIYGIHLCR